MTLVPTLESGEGSGVRKLGKPGSGPVLLLPDRVAMFLYLSEPGFSNWKGSGETFFPGMMGGLCEGAVPEGVVIIIAFIAAK